MEDSYGKYSEEDADPWSIRGGFGAAEGENARAGDKYGVYAGFSLDQYKQSQAIGLIYNDHSGTREVGLKVWDRPETSQSEFIERGDVIRKMPDGPEKDAARKSL